MIHLLCQQCCRAFKAFQPKLYMMNSPDGILFRHGSGGYSRAIVQLIEYELYSHSVRIFQVDDHLTATKPFLWMFKLNVEMIESFNPVVYCIIRKRKCGSIDLPFTMSTVG